ncbi:hypothetical protein RRG08_064069 [Elysia crispata]|uniref:Uncharacterized protein n=1 Tax=Elysia crispata TaxID=231223 RepID=A0AAE1CXL0_9GAST|nr:hypothetical protein RRG08_064069 [Elysia crispata]
MTLTLIIRGVLAVNVVLSDAMVNKNYDAVDDDDDDDDGEEKAKDDDKGVEEEQKKHVNTYAFPMTAQCPPGRALSLAGQGCASVVLLLTASSSCGHTYCSHRKGRGRTPIRGRGCLRKKTKSVSLKAVTAGPVNGVSVSLSRRCETRLGSSTEAILDILLQQHCFVLIGSNICVTMAPSECLKQPGSSASDIHVQLY